MNKKLLVTGYEPFGGSDINPSWMAVSQLPDNIGGVEVIKKEIPVEWYKAPNMLYKLIEEHMPLGVMCVGQGTGTKINLERIGVNLCNGKDNAGITLEDKPVFLQGPAAYFSTFPYSGMKSALEKDSIPVQYSFSAGLYLCNCILYSILHFSACRFPGLRGGFVHVPRLPEQSEGGDSMPIDTTIQAVRICAEEFCINIAAEA